MCQSHRQTIANLPILFSLLYLHCLMLQVCIEKLRAKKDEGFFDLVENVNSELANFYRRRTYRDKRLIPIPYLIVPKHTHLRRQKILVLVPSAITNFVERALWRQTYGQPLIKKKFQYNLLFSVGTSNETSVQNQLISESQTYGDILQSDFFDSYKNLSIKMLSAFRYVTIAAVDANAVLKVDDDISWRIENVTTYIKRNVDPKCAAFHCYRHREGKSLPYNKTKKWYTSPDEYQGSTIPAYCLGWSYIATIPALEAVLRHVPDNLYFWHFVLLMYCVLLVLSAAITCRRRKSAAQDIRPSLRTFLADRKAKSVGMDSGSMAEDPKQEQNVKDKVQNEEKFVEEKKTQASEQQLLDVAQEVYQKQQKRLAEPHRMEQEGGDYENFGPSKSRPNTPKRSDDVIVTARQTLASNSTKEKDAVRNSTKKDKSASARFPTDATQDMSIVEKSKMYKIRRGEIAI